MRNTGTVRGTMLAHFLPTGWAYVDYVNASGKHLLRWIKAEQLLIKP
jgi:hypothetical protein